MPPIWHHRSNLMDQSSRARRAASAKAHRDSLRARGVKVVIPEKTDQRANRKNNGSRGGRAVGFDAEDYKHALIYRGAMVLASTVLWLTA